MKQPSEPCVLINQSFALCRTFGSMKINSLARPKDLMTKAVNLAIEMSNKLKYWCHRLQTTVEQCETHHVLDAS